jgi:cytochrome c-type biogenesis protein CcmH
MPSPGWQRFKRGPGWILLGAVVVALMAIGLAQNSDVLSPEERIEAISKRLACPICDGESVFESRNNASESLRNEIRAQVDAGVASDDQIITFIEQRYGAQVLLVPRADGVDALVWILPVVALVCGVAGLAFAFRRWKRAGGDVPTDDDRALVAEARRAGLDDDPPTDRPTTADRSATTDAAESGEGDGDGS